MDAIFFAFCALFFVFGCLRGGVRLTLSFLTTILSVVVASIFCSWLADILWGVNNFGFSLNGWLQNLIDDKFVGVFSDKESLLEYLTNSNLGALFGVFFEKVLKNISFDGSLTVGQVVSGTISNLIIKVISFALIYVVAAIVLKIVCLLIIKIFQKNQFLKISDRLLGGAIGIFKAFLIFFVCYFLLVQFANFTLNENVIAFLNGSPITNTIYNEFILKIFNKII